MITPFKILEICNKEHISIEAFVLGYSLYEIKKNTESYIKEYDFYLRDNLNSILFKTSFKAALADLIAKKFLIDRHYSSSYAVYGVDFSLLEITDKFKDLFLVQEEEAWLEVIRAYPMFLMIDNKRVNAQSTKNPCLSSYYFEKVIKNGNKDLHKEFLTLIKSYYKGEKSVTHGTGLEKCLYSWESTRLMIIEELKETVEKPKMYLEL